MTNILLTSAGRRSYLANYFKQALAGNGQVIATNTHAYAPAMQVADKAIVVPPSFDKNYIPTIVSICKENHIDLICSLHDLDVFVLSSHRDQLLATGAFPVVPEDRWARICLDKYECNEQLNQHAIDVPWTGIDLSKALDALGAGDLHFPVIIKDRWGFGSKGLSLCHNIDELKHHYHYALKANNNMAIPQFSDYPTNQSVLIQQGVTGKEYCINIVNDLQGQYISHFASEVHAMRAGETDSVTTTHPDIAGDLPIRLSKLTNHPGIWGIDIVLDAQNKANVIDINPRFTGDYPFQHICGANIPAALIAWVKGDKPQEEWFKPEIGITGFKDLVPTRLQ